MTASNKAFNLPPVGSSSEALPAIAAALEIEPNVETALAEVASRLDDLFEKTRLAAQLRDAELLESILGELSILNDFRRSLNEVYA